MDPLGFALENFDAIGQWRDDDDGARDQRDDHAARRRRSTARRRFARRCCARATSSSGPSTEKLLTYALGRGVEYYDAPTVRQLVRDAGADDYRWSSLVLGIVAERAVPDAASADDARPELRRRPQAPSASRVRPSRAREEQRVSHVHHQDASVPSDGAARPRRDARVAAARQHGAGADGAEPDRRGAGAAAGRVLRAQRHVDGLLVAESRRAARRAAADAAVAGGVQGPGPARAAGWPTRPRTWSRAAAITRGRPARS